MLSTDADLISWCILKTRLVKDFIFNEFCLFLFKEGTVMFYQKSSQDILKECESSLEGLYDFQVKKHSAKY